VHDAANPQQNRGCSDLPNRSQLIRGIAFAAATAPRSRGWTSLFRVAADRTDVGRHEVPRLRPLCCHAVGHGAFRRARSVLGHPPQDGHPVGGAPRPTAALPQPDLLLAGVGFAALDVLGDQHVTVEDPYQMVRGDGLDRLPGQHDRHPIAEPGPTRADRPGRPSAAPRAVERSRAPAPPQPARAGPVRAPAPPRRRDRVAARRA
jgi:hypothetical protein